ncbi:MAG: HAMP domain-containing protein [Chloroflexi bacterium]|nr:HAMP domain-containing protein [Chloroflexota bacterium]
MTIRLRLTLLYSGILVIIIALFGIVVFGILDRTLRNRVDDNLLQVLDDLEPDVQRMMTPDGEIEYTPSSSVDTFHSPGVFVQLWLVNNRDYPFNLSHSGHMYHAPLDPDVLDTRQQTETTVTIDDVNLRVITRPVVVDDQIVGHLQAASSLEPVESATERLLWIMLASGLAATIVSFGLGNWLASRALSPINRISETARAIVVTDDLSRRVPIHQRQDELGSLVTTINQMLERLEKLFNTQRRFVADISHELRTPITAIQGHIELMQRFGSDASSLDIINNETQRMAQLVGDLLLLAQADLGRLPLARYPVELEALVLKVHNYARTLSQDRVQVELGTLDHAVAEVDEERLKQLLHNLISNALQYTSENGTLTLSLHHCGDCAEIRVADTGIGIPAQHLPHIFERFYRVDEARSRHEGGAGLGLSIATWIAEAHGGKLIATSEVGQGSTFIVRLPLLPEKHPQQPPTANTPK